MNDDMTERLGQIAADAARAAVETSVQETRDALHQQVDASLQPVRSITGPVSAFVRDRPLAAVLAAAAAGFTLAWLRRA